VLALGDSCEGSAAHRRCLSPNVCDSGYPLRIRGRERTDRSVAIGRESSRQKIVTLALVSDRVLIASVDPATFGEQAEVEVEVKEEIAEAIQAEEENSNGNRSRRRSRNRFSSSRSHIPIYSRFHAFAPHVLFLPRQFRSIGEFISSDSARGKWKCLPGPGGI